jgi:hypothetical protein
MRDDRFDAGLEADLVCLFCSRFRLRSSCLEQLTGFVVAFIVANEVMHAKFRPY